MKLRKALIYMTLIGEPIEINLNWVTLTQCTHVIISTMSNASEDSNESILYNYYYSVCVT